MTLSEPSVVSLQIRLFGPIEVSVRRDPLPALRSRKGYWLLALLALRAGRELERSWVVATLWPDSSPGRCNEWIAKSMRADLARVSAHSQPWVGLQWEIYDALADLNTFSFVAAQFAAFFRQARSLRCFTPLALFGDVNPQLALVRFVGGNSHARGEFGV